MDHFIFEGGGGVGQLPKKNSCIAKVKKKNSFTLHFSISHVSHVSHDHQSLQWNVCAAHANNISSNLIKCIAFSGLSGATVDWSRFTEQIT